MIPHIAIFTTGVNGSGDNLIMNHDDNMAFEYVITRPACGIKKKNITFSDKTLYKKGKFKTSGFRKQSVCVCFVYK